MASGKSARFHFVIEEIGLFTGTRLRFSIFDIYRLAADADGFRATGMIQIRFRLRDRSKIAATIIAVVILIDYYRLCSC